MAGDLDVEPGHAFSVAIATGRKAPEKKQPITLRNPATPPDTG